jgi:hypothetical protein
MTTRSATLLARSAACLLAGCLLAAPSAMGQSGPAEQTTYLLGEVKTLSPSGQLLSTSLSLVRRVQRPADNRIVEVVATIEPAKPVREFTTTFTIDGSQFTMRDEEGTFNGAGRLVGEPWAWTGWSYEAELAGARKGWLKGEDRLDSTGLTAKKSFAAPDGTVRVLFEERLQPIGRATYEILRARLVTMASDGR